MEKEIKMVNNQETKKLKLMIRKIRGSFCEKCHIPLFMNQVVLHHRNKNRKENNRSNLNIFCDGCHREIHSCEDKDWLDQK